MGWGSCCQSLLVDGSDLLSGSLAWFPRGQSLLGLDLSESFMSGQLSDFIPIICESLSAQWVTLDPPRQTLVGRNPCSWVAEGDPSVVAQGGQCGPVWPVFAY